MEEKDKQKENNANYASISEENYTLDENLDKAYKTNTSYVTGGIKIAVLYNLCLCFGLYYFSRNISYFKSKYLRKKEITNFNIIKKTLWYTFIPLVLISPNVFILLGIHPIKVFKDRKKMEEELLSSAEIQYSLSGLDLLYKKHVKSTFKEEVANVLEK
jgi:hypothetical protein